MVVCNHQWDYKPILNFNVKCTSAKFCRLHTAANLQSNIVATMTGGLARSAVAVSALIVIRRVRTKEKEEATKEKKKEATFCEGIYITQGAQMVMSAMLPVVED